jgi:hypothetical protein
MIGEPCEVVKVYAKANAQAGASIIWNGIAFETLVISAKAEIQSVDGAFPMACEVDSRFRGNDCTWECPCLANDTRAAQARVGVSKRVYRAM